MGAALAAAVLVAACGNLIELPGQGPAPSMFRRPVPSFSPPQHALEDVRLRVQEPDAPRTIDTDRIALYPSPIEVKYFADARWSDRPSRLMQTLMVDTLAATGAFEFVGPDADGVSTRYALRSNLTAFHGIFDGGDRTIVVTLRVSLIDRPAGRILAGRTLSQSVDPGSSNVRDAVRAFSTASEAILQELNAWVVQTIEADLANGRAATG